MADPLAGQRRSLLDGNITVLKWPDTCPAEIKVGRRFRVGSIEVEITAVRESVKPGKGRWWIAEFVRHEKERVYLLRYAPPAHADREEGQPDKASIGRARVESAYTSTPHSASPHEPESVGPDWKDTRLAERELERQKARAERMSTEQTEAEVDKLAARVKQVGKTRARGGHDLTHLLADVYERLAAEEKDAA